MARLTQQQIATAVQPFLEPGEQVLYCAYGIQQPSWLLIAPLVILAILPGLITQALLSKYYMVVLTNRRGLLVHCAGKLKPREIIEYRPGAIPPVTVSQGPFSTVMRITDPLGAIRIRFYRAAVANNREQAAAIGNALAARPTA